MRSRRNPIIDGHKVCPKCMERKPVGAFGQHGARKKVPSYCKPCKTAYRREKAAQFAKQQSGLGLTKKGPASGKPLMGPAPQDVRERFMAKVRKIEGGHWIWEAARDYFGYPRFAMHVAVYPAHRVSLWLSGVDVTPGMCVDHICQVRGCVNPEHLRIVTPTVSARENNESPFSKNYQKTHCKYGHPLSGDNIIWIPCRSPRGTDMKTRVCLTCRPFMVNSSRRCDPPDNR